MAWVMTSKRYPGASGTAPSVKFAVGGILIAEITMASAPPQEWLYTLDYYVPGGLQEETFESFSKALIRLHELLNGPGPVGFEVFKSKGKPND